MDAETKDKLQVDVLLHESTQLHDNIERCLREMNTLFTFAFPAVTAAFSLTVGDKLLAVDDPGTLYSLFAVLSSVIAIVFNNVWMQLLGFTRYKYAEVLPRLYRLTGRDGDNFGQYVSRGGLARTMTGAIVIQAVLLPVAATCCHKVWHLYHQNTFALAAYFSLALALLTTPLSWRVAYQTVQAAKPHGPPIPPPARPRR